MAYIYCVATRFYGIAFLNYRYIVFKCKYNISIFYDINNGIDNKINVLSMNNVRINMDTFWINDERIYVQIITVINGWEEIILFRNT